MLLWSGFPILFIVLSSLKPSRDIFVYPPVWLFEPTFQHYVELWRQWPVFFGYLRNSLIIACFATLLAVGASTLAGFVYSRYRSRLLTASAFFLIAVRLLPPIVITLPLFPTVDFLGLSDTHLLLVVLYATFFVSLNTVIMKAFIDGIPRELDDAARVDGASELQTLFRVILPLAAQGMVAAAVFVFVFSWNEFLFAFIFTTSNAKTAPLDHQRADGLADRRRLGHAVRRGEPPARADRGLPAAAAALPDRRPDRRLAQGLIRCATISISPAAPRWSPARAAASAARSPGLPSTARVAVHARAR